MIMSSEMHEHVFIYLSYVNILSVVYKKNNEIQHFKKYVTHGPLRFRIISVMVVTMI
jgi:hypothetical protein